MFLLKGEDGMVKSSFLTRKGGIKKKILSVALILAIVSTLFVISPASTVSAAVGGPVVPANGQLKIVGTQLCNQYGQAIQLRGVSSAGLQWYGQFMNKSSIQWLRDDWGITVIRAALYTNEKDKGYIANPSLKDKVKEVVQAAIDLGIYVIIDWHTLNDNDPNTYKAQAKTFFQEMATLYGSYPNVIYEICNEPNGRSVTWSGSIKPYAQEIIPAIRAIDPDGIVLVGTPTWSQDVDIAASDPLSYNNIMYVCHFYSGTHKQSLRDKISSALNMGAPIFVSEWGTSLSTGTGGVFIPESDEWLSFLDQKKISWVNWSLCDKAETSAILNAGASTTGGWSASNLTQSGQYVKSKIPGSGIPTSIPSASPTSTNTPVPPSPTPTNTPVRGYSITGYVASEFTSNNPGLTKSGFRVEVSGTGMSASTDVNGSFRIDNVPTNLGGYTVKVSKANYISREIRNVVVNNSNVTLGSQSSPIIMWPGDIAINGSQDSAINMSDILQMASRFNGVQGDGRYEQSYDFNADNVINMSDVLIIARYFNKTSSDYPANV